MPLNLDFSVKLESTIICLQKTEVRVYTNRRVFSLAGESRWKAELLNQRFLFHNGRSRGTHRDHACRSGRKADECIYHTGLGEPSETPVATGQRYSTADQLGATLGLYLLTRTHRDRVCRAGRKADECNYHTGLEEPSMTPVATDQTLKRNSSFGSEFL